MPRRAAPLGEGKRVPLMLRTTREVRHTLEQAAAQSGRSLSQEVERLIDVALEHEATAMRLDRIETLLASMTPMASQKVLPEA